MKSEGIVLIGKGRAEKAFQRRSIELPELKDDEVLIESEAFGLNYADVMARNGLYRDAPPKPCVLGYELVGKVVQIGKNVDEALLDKRVLAFTRFGGYGKHAITKSNALVLIDETPAEEAMALCTQAVTAYYMAEYVSSIHKGEIVLIHAAAGGVGTILIQLAKMKGAFVIAKVGSDEKGELAKKIGADLYINYKKGDYQTQLAQALPGKKIDVIFNPVAGSTYKKDFSILAAGGRIFLYGGSEMAGGKFGILSTLNFLRKMGVLLPVVLMMSSKNILGVNMLRIADDKPEVLQTCLEAVIELYKKGKLIPQIGGVYSVDEIAVAHNQLEDGQTSGKLTIKW